MSFIRPAVQRVVSHAIDRRDHPDATCGTCPRPAAVVAWAFTSAPSAPVIERPETRRYACVIPRHVVAARTAAEAAGVRG